MSSTIVLSLYALVAAGTALWVLVARRSVGSLSSAPAAAIAALLWPFVLPALFSSRDEATPESSSACARVTVATAALRDARRRAGHSTRGRIRQSTIDAFLSRTRARAARLQEIDLALSAATGPTRERLAQLRRSLAGQVEAAIALMDGLVGELTLLRLAGFDDAAAARLERNHLQALLDQLEALGDASLEATLEPEA